MRVKLFTVLLFAFSVSLCAGRYGCFRQRKRCKSKVGWMASSRALRAERRNRIRQKDNEIRRLTCRVRQLGCFEAKVLSLTNRLELERDMHKGHSFEQQKALVYAKEQARCDNWRRRVADKLQDTLRLNGILMEDIPLDGEPEDTEDDFEGNVPENRESTAGKLLRLLCCRRSHK